VYDAIQVDILVERYMIQILKRLLTCSGIRLFLLSGDYQ